MSEINISFLQDVAYRKRHDGLGLHQSNITDWVICDNFAEAVEAILTHAVYPKPQASKYETYGFTPTLFMPSTNKYGEDGVWRDGQFAADHLTLFVADLDNQHPDHTMIDIDTLESVLKTLGLSYLLYTSFSHTPERHKIRIVTPVSRELTPDEAFRVFMWFNVALDRQLDHSIYDPGDYLYGPPNGGEVRVDLDGDPLDVDGYLALSDTLPVEDRTYTRSDRPAFVTATPEQLAVAKAQWINVETTAGASIYNPVFFNPEWLPLIGERYVDGSRHQTMKGLLAKAWIKSGRTLTRSDLETMQNEIDAEYGLYLSHQYGRRMLSDDIRDTMYLVSNDNPEVNYPKHLDRSIQMAARLMKMKKNVCY